MPNIVRRQNTKSVGNILDDINWIHPVYDRKHFALTIMTEVWLPTVFQPMNQTIVEDKIVRNEKLRKDREKRMKSTT